MNLNKIKDTLNQYGEFGFELGIDLLDFYADSYREATSMLERIMPKGYPKTKLTDGSNWIEILSGFEVLDNTYPDGDSTCIYTFSAVSNTDDVDIIRNIVSDYVSKYYDGVFEILIEESEDSEITDSEKTYNTNMNVGKSKYVVNFHDGVKKHPDGSEFFDVAIFKNKKEANNFIEKLEKDGYKGTGIFDSSIKDSLDDMISYTAVVNLDSKTDLEKYGIDQSELSMIELVSEYNYDNFEDALQEGVELCYQLAKEFPDEIYTLDIIPWDANREIVDREFQSYTCWLDHSTGKIVFA